MYEPKTTRTYAPTISEKRKVALEMLHSTREKRHSLERELKSTECQLVDSLKREINQLRSLEKEAELKFTATK